MRMFNGSIALEEEFIQERIDEEYNRREAEYKEYVRQLHNARVAYECSLQNRLTMMLFISFLAILMIGFAALFPLNMQIGLTGAAIVVVLFTVGMELEEIIKRNNKNYE